MNPQMQNLEYIKLTIGLEHPGICVSIVGTGSNQPQIPRDYYSELDTFNIQDKSHKFYK